MKVRQDFSEYTLIRVIGCPRGGKDNVDVVKKKNDFV